ncbi:IS1634 family transposase [Ectothiorhodospira haloalkaliphila]|uniref:IS1634 family transposase n=1 Tax=Ectothiorhodospira haloalkaliphila TaxID=421628 RepID=UPI001EE8296C|nr:IS1634 family transposase [Ectothiorhodospira haloalkaliphila]MCG5526337.1 IS1634 family transposase [Ectothiorhodospira haloalkaliphila]
MALGYNQSMYIDIVPNRNSPPAILLRESTREGGRIVKRTLANLSSLSREQAESIRAVLKGEPLAPVDSLFEVVRSRTHGAVQAIGLAMQRLRLGSLLDSKPSRQRDLVLAMIAARVRDPQSKLATSRSWDHSTLGEWFGVADADEHELYGALDWLLERQDKIEQRLARRHLTEGGRVLYDLSSSYLEGSHCPLGQRGYSRDGKKGRLQVNYGLLTDDRGCPVSISVFAGNTSDPQTLMAQVDSLQDRFDLQSVILVGDRGMISQKQIEALDKRSGVDWITALKNGAIRKLVDTGAIQMSLFDEHNLFEFTDPAYPGERLIVCRNPSLATLRAEKRDALLAATTRELETVQRMVASGRLKVADKIGVRVGKVINKYKMAKHFELDIQEGHFHFQINAAQVAEEAVLDGLYVIRTSVPSEHVSTDDTVRHYKSLSQVEAAFRSLKSDDLKIRPIYHYTEDRVRAHLLLCMLAYYVKWHMTEAWRPLLFADADREHRAEADPVASATRSDTALEKIATKTLDDGTPTHSFRTLLNELATIVRNTCRRRHHEAEEPTFELDTKPNAKQRAALDRISAIRL